MRTSHSNIIELKSQAITMRMQGDSYPMIEKATGVSRSTLSGWLGKLELPQIANEMIIQRKRDYLVGFRKLASEVHRRARNDRKKVILTEVADEFENIEFDRMMKEALLVMLYIGEGFKTRRGSIGLGNSNSDVLKIYVKLLREVYQVEEHRFRCYLHLRADQDSVAETEYWSRILGIPTSAFRKPQFDKRTLGKKTWEGYHGVCSVHYYDARFQHRIEAFQELLIKELLARAVSSVG